MAVAASGGWTLRWALWALLWATRIEGGVGRGPGAVRAATPTAPDPGGSETATTDPVIVGSETVTPGGETVTPGPVTPGGETVTPGLVTASGETVTPGPVTPGGETVTPGPVTPGGETVTPGPVTPGGETVTPGPVTPGGETVTPGLVTPGGKTVTPGPVTPGGETVTPGPVTPDGGAVTLSADHATAQNLTAAVPICTCDLTAGVCEVDCCCDPDCSSADIQVFSSCLPGSEPVISQACIEESMIFTSNSPFRTVFHEDGSDTLFCVIINDPKTNYFVAPQSVTRERFPVLVSQFGRASFIVPSQQQSIRGISMNTTGPKDFYQVGDLIITLFQDALVLGVLMQPTALTGGECTDSNPAGFLQDRRSTCTRSVGDLRTTCETLPALKPATYFQNFVLLVSPNYTAVDGVHILPENKEILSSPWIEDNMCINVVSEVTYRIKYKGEEGILGAQVTFGLTNITLSATKIQQNFHIFFIADPANYTAERRSGNPGYLRGKPILAFNGERATILTVLKSAGDGSCSQLDRNRVFFQRNMRAGCSYRFVPGLTCSELQKNINLILLGDNPPHSLGILGNSSGRKPESLTRIINSAPEAPNVICETSCILSLALDIQILWANLGPLSNPQAAVLGARFQYQRQQVQCSSGRLSPRTSITFIETTQYPLAPRDQPATEWKLPFDFFHPFKVLNSGIGVSVGPVLHTACSVIVIGLLGQC
ncbi:tectonic-3-like [Heterodontus francisci]|uniref:tectonic-3-like n=1 Tax=Heterodontus francisci TaxID=7792 RepID=UPI00355B6FBC